MLTDVATSIFDCTTIQPPNPQQDDWEITCEWFDQLFALLYPGGPEAGLDATALETNRERLREGASFLHQSITGDLSNAEILNSITTDVFPRLIAYYARICSIPVADTDQAIVNKPYEFFEGLIKRNITQYGEINPAPNQEEQKRIKQIIYERLVALLKALPSVYLQGGQKTLQLLTNDCLKGIANPPKGLKDAILIALSAYPNKSTHPFFMAQVIARGDMVLYKNLSDQAIETIVTNFCNNPNINRDQLNQILEGSRKHTYPEGQKFVSTLEQRLAKPVD